ncbi:MAG: hypothetical protein A2902_03160 [Elusimicrobia bacterium RIFCSPLOWO2_01_FULL_64_13]|nr:MAG: hypothetical protein A2636_04515 [Elusimicrobia bacterium RIFCSPHIGHO2_01_FULL_64_10]OGR96222.1 MAG: hypothetical protein A2902_03160 [Elusimicrobia bacterium RIFCSPLOWO2_01_FULL_64_13]
MNLDQKLIYLVDDEEGVRRSLETILRDEGYTVHGFPNGREIVAFTEKEAPRSRPILALVDLRLPDIDGVEVMHKIKAVSPETEILMLTGNPDMTSAIESVNAGAYAYLLKPYQFDDIKRTIRRLTEKQKLIEENRELTEKLKKWNEKLEDEVFRRTVALRDSYRKLETLYQMRSQFVSIMSHELRTPTTALVGFAETLRTGWDHLSKEKIQDYLNIISVESSRMVTLMSEIFEISRIHEGKLELHPESADLGGLVKEVVDDFRGRHPKISFGFHLRSDSMAARVDPGYFKTMLDHILSNAVKYTPPEGHILIFAERTGDRCAIRVEDDGPGIPRELQEKVFEPFFRSMDNVNRKNPGAGLGLTISRGIVNNMGGDIQLAQKITGRSGCAVVVTVPFQTPAKE